MVIHGRDILTGRFKVDECYVGGKEEGLLARLNLEKTLVVIAVQEDGAGIGRIRIRQILDVSAESRSFASPTKKLLSRRCMTG